MISKVISGGQTGADQAGWRAAKRCGIETLGWMPKGFKTEAGTCPEFKELYGAMEHPSADYPARTTSNIGLADMTFLFGDARSPGGRLAQRIASEINHPITVIDSPEKYPPLFVVHIMKRWGYVTSLNVAGNRESSSPGIGAWVEAYLVEVFTILGHKA